MKILLIRMMGLGDVASILIPAIKLFARNHPGADIDALSYGPGVELLAPMPELNAILAVYPEQWPDELFAAIDSFSRIAQTIASRDYALIVNLDTWFMPCFMARLLKDAGQPVTGNYLAMSVSDFANRLHENQFSPQFFQQPFVYLASSFARMADWFVPNWWDREQAKGGYPAYYLNHCCGLEGDVDISLATAPAAAFSELPAGQRVVAISAFGRSAHKRYKETEALSRLFESAGYHVWSGFDGSIPLDELLGRLKQTDLLVTVPTSSRWLAKLVGCPVLMIPGGEPPIMTVPEVTLPKFLDCQYCMQPFCPKGLDYACMSVPPADILLLARAYLDGEAGGYPRRRLDQGRV